ncbi:glycosyltransferase family 2 protein [Aureimonas ureilytica]|uniref:glycosyltransferase family 2 protein n=1 Tax=Aureimonas ureilytica TaxID=401562 RepID=UPI000363B43E|nr:glycosyltransferase family A protein [Aureimonas ureilytica]
MTSWTKTPAEEAARRARHGQTPVVVVIPYYNGSDFIERSARSVLEQTVPPAEFLVVDDGSTAEEAARLDAIAERMGFTVLRKANGGQGSARNHGVRHSTSPFICFLDQDDFYLKTHIETLIDAMPDDDPHFGWVYGELFEADGDGQVVRTSIVSHHSSHPKTSLADLLANDMHVLPSASLIAREAFEAVDGFDEQFMGYEDDDLFLRIFRRGYTNHFTPKPVTVWCIHTESTSYGIRMARSRWRYFQKLIGLFPDDPEKGRFFVRDLMIKRFHQPIMREARNAALDVPGKYTAHKREYLQIANDYVATLLAMPSIPASFKKKLVLRRRVLNSPHARHIFRILFRLERLKAYLIRR